MTTCALCGVDSARTARVSGLDLCKTCRLQDPTEALRKRGIGAQYSERLQRLLADFVVPVAHPDVVVSFVPERFGHKIMKLAVTELQVGDPLFDDAVYIRTNDADTARTVLSNEGVQSAILGLLTGMDTTDLIANHVTLEGPRLSIQLKPMGFLSERVDDLKLEAAALALHLAADA